MTTDSNNTDTSSLAKPSDTGLIFDDLLTKLPNTSSFFVNTQIPQVTLPSSLVLTSTSTLNSTFLALRKQQNEVVEVYNSAASTTYGRISGLLTQANAVTTPISILLDGQRTWTTTLPRTELFNSPSLTVTSSSVGNWITDQRVQKTDDTIIIERVVSRITKEVADEVMYRIEQKETRIITNYYPLFDPDEPALVIAGKVIVIRKNTNEEAFAKIIFADDETLAKEWSWDEIAELWDEENWHELYKPTTVYTAANGLKEKIAKKTGILDYLITTRKTTQVNPKYLE